MEQSNGPIFFLDYGVGSKAKLVNLRLLILVLLPQIVKIYSLY